MNIAKRLRTSIFEEHLRTAASGLCDCRFTDHTRFFYISIAFFQLSLSVV